MNLASTKNESRYKWTNRHSPPTFPPAPSTPGCSSKPRDRPEIKHFHFHWDQTLSRKPTVEPFHSWDEYHWDCNRGSQALAQWSPSPTEHPEHFQSNHFARWPSMMLWCVAPELRWSFEKAKGILEDQVKAIEMKIKNLWKCFDPGHIIQGSSVDRPYHLGN